MFAGFWEILRFLQAVLVGKNARTEKRENAPKGTKLCHFAQTHARFPCIIPPLACTQTNKRFQSNSSGMDMTGRPGHRTMEMNGGSSASYLARTPCFPCFMLCLLRVETEGLLDYQGRAGIMSIVRWNLRPVIFGVELGPKMGARPKS